MKTLKHKTYSHISLTSPLSNLPLPFITLTCCNLPPFTLKPCSVTNITNSDLAEPQQFTCGATEFSWPCRIGILFHQLLPYARFFLLQLFFELEFTLILQCIRFHTDLGNGIGYSPKFKVCFALYLQITCTGKVNFISFFPFRSQHTSCDKIVYGS